MDFAQLAATDVLGVQAAGPDQQSGTGKSNPGRWRHAMITIVVTISAVIAITVSITFRGNNRKRS
jgi:hypothetical protein